MNAVIHRVIEAEDKEVVLGLVHHVQTTNKEVGLLVQTHKVEVEDDETNKTNKTNNVKGNRKEETEKGTRMEYIGTKIVQNVNPIDDVK